MKPLKVSDIASSVTGLAVGVSGDVLMASRTKRPCSICGRVDVLKRTWCATHYQRWRRHGDPTVRLAPGRKPKPPSLVARCGDCGAVVGLVATPAGVWGALAAHRCEAS